MTAFAADLLALWLGVTAACSLLLLAVVAVQGACARAQRWRTARRRRGRPDRSSAGPPTGRRAGAPDRQGVT